MSAPRGYVWVTGGDYNTYGAIRSATVWQYADRVTIPREPRTLDVNDPNFGRSREPEDYMNSRELAAYRLWQQNARGVFARTFSRLESQMYRAEVTIYQQGPNYSASLLVRQGDLTPE